MASTVKLPNVAGMFYEADPVRLTNMLQEFLANARPAISNIPRILIVPHAGYIYSGPIAASAYKQWMTCPSPQEVVILSPTHYHHLSTIASLDVNAYQTPLGKVSLNSTVIEQLVQKKLVNYRPEVFEREHALEVHLPFLQFLFKELSIIPLIVGQVDAAAVIQLLLALDDGKRLFVVSTDLSHFHSHEIAKSLDLETANWIETCQSHRLTGQMACGHFPLRGVLDYARLQKMTVKKLDLRDSSDTAGDPERVVGYGAFAIYSSSSSPSEKTQASKV